MSGLLALIPARGGSKGVPRKNVMPIAGQPLIGWTIDAALASGVFNRVVVSTEDAEIAEAARDCGAEVPFMRPASLAADDTPGIAPVLHALGELPSFDAVVLLQPTSPLRSGEDIAGIVALASSSGARSVVSVSEPDAHPQWTYRMGADGVLAAWEPPAGATRRQDLEAAYALNGAMYYAECDFVRETGALVGPGTIGYPMPAERSIDIDTPLDWRIAELMLMDSRIVAKA